MFFARRDDLRIPHNPKRQRGDGFPGESVSALTLGVIRHRRMRLMDMPLCGAGFSQALACSGFSPPFEAFDHRYSSAD